eukprot:TRINITY_DN17644_c0_g1_i1.p1 TRINITY_DN17644_c0_g1~~TRINITY_DN17644_c0_g1_i1.p1  ORF type:complete len:906 (+),score=196.64 TRINITY_DN17644_c0_g1_i1:136-2853(+)
MAVPGGPRRIEVHGAQGLQLPRGLHLRSRDRVIVVEVLSAGSSQPCRTRPFEVAEDGSARLDPPAVLFAPAPSNGDALRVRVSRCDKAGAPEDLVGEAQVPGAGGRASLTVVRNGKSAGEVAISVNEALPSRAAPAPSTPAMSTPGGRGAPSSPLSPPGGSSGAPSPAQLRRLPAGTAPTPTTSRPPTATGDMAQRSPLSSAAGASGYSSAATSAAANAASAGVASATPNAGAGAASAAAAASASRVAPRYCDEHNESSKRLKEAPSSKLCKGCGLMVQTSYAQFTFCPPCSEARRACMICGAEAPQAGSYVPAKRSGQAAQDLPPAPHGQSPLSTAATAAAAPKVAAAGHSPAGPGAGVGSLLPAPGRRGPRSSEPPVPRRPLRKRHCALDDAGTCDVTIEAVDGLGELLDSPHLIVSLEGEEFRAEQDDLGYGRCEPAFQFPFAFASLQSDLHIYCYEPSSQVPVGRALVPLSSVVWPYGDAPSMEHVLNVFKKGAILKRSMVVHFLPSLVGGDGYKDPAFLDKFETGFLRRGVGDTNAPFGSVSVSVEIALRPEVPSLAKLYGRAVMGGATLAQAMDPARLSQIPARGIAYMDRETGRATASYGGGAGTGGQAGDSVLADGEVEKLLVALMRLRRFFLGGGGWKVAGDWLKAERWRAFAAAAAWFLFCWLGYFPPALWQVPAYFFVLLLANGILVQTARRRRLEEAADAIASGALPGLLEDTQDPLDARDRRILLLQAARELEPIVSGLVVGLERLRNLVSFADGPASVVFYAAVGAFCALMCLSFGVITWLEPVTFVCGLYGAFLIVMGNVKKGGAAATNPVGAIGGGNAPQAALLAGAPAAGDELPEFLSLRRLGVALAPPWGACVPDESELLHRFAARRLSEACTAAPGSPQSSGTRAR